MTSNEFQSSLYPTQRQMLDAMVEQYLTDGNTASEVAQSLTTMTDEALAAEVIEHWGLDQRGLRAATVLEDESPSHMEREEYAAADLAAAFARFRT
jgi:hypothetical protein